MKSIAAALLFLPVIAGADVIGINPADLAQYVKAPHRYAHFIETDIGLDTWARSAEGDVVIFEKELSSPGAVSMGFYAEDVSLPDGVTLAVSDAHGKIVAQMSPVGGRMISNKVLGDRAVLRINSPANVATGVRFQIKEVQVGFKTLPTDGLHAEHPAFSEAKAADAKADGAPTGNGGTAPPSFYNQPESCFRNHACYKSPTTETVADATVLLNFNGGAFCSGSLVMNAARDFKPYVLTAKHCIDGLSADQISRTQFHWKAEQPCGSDKYWEAGAGDYSRTTFGGSAKFIYGDVALLLSDAAPASGSNPYWLGIDATRNGKSCTGGGIDSDCSLPSDARVEVIHHSNNRPRSAAYNARPVKSLATQGLYSQNETRLRWAVTGVWNQTGAVDVGASGSALIYGGRTIGVMSTANLDQSCTNSYQGEMTYHAERLLDVWDNPSAPGGGLKSVLDPSNASAGLLEGARNPALSGAPDVSLILQPSTIVFNGQSKANISSSKGQNCTITYDGVVTSVPSNGSLNLAGRRAGDFPVTLECSSEDGTKGSTTAVLTVQPQTSNPPTPVPTASSGASSGGGSFGLGISVLALLAGLRRRTA